MTNRTTTLKRAVIVAVLVAGTGTLLIRQHQATQAHANHLYRTGRAEESVGVYRGAMDPSPEPTEAFNLGTALVLLDPDSAGLMLERSAQEASDPSLEQRALYNLGFHLFLAAHRGLERDSAYILLDRAVTVDRLALRLDPTDDDVRWNLAIAQRALDAMQPPGRNQGRESSGDNNDEVAMNEAAMARAESQDAEAGAEQEQDQEVSNTGERQSGQRGAQETWATQDPRPMAAGRAVELLSTVVDDPEELLKGILWAHRPDVAWWAGQPYPGGDW